MPLVCGKDPRKIWEPAIGSLGRPAAVLAGIWRGRRRDWLGKGGDVACSHQGLDSGVWMGSGSGRRGARRRQAMAAAGSSALARVWSDLGNKLKD
jgi:hypothetical protein